MAKRKPKPKKRRKPLPKRKHPHAKKKKSVKRKKQRPAKKKTKAKAAQKPRFRYGTERAEKLKAGVSGHGTTIKVYSRKLKQKAVIDRRSTFFSPGYRVSRGPSGGSQLAKRIGPRALKHFRAIGESQKNFYYFRIMYDFKLLKEVRFAHFSVGITAIRNDQQFVRYIKDTVRAFIASLDGYVKSGYMAQVRVTGIVVQGYK